MEKCTNISCYVFVALKARLVLLNDSSQLWTVVEMIHMSYTKLNVINATQLRTTL